MGSQVCITYPDPSLSPLKRSPLKKKHISQNMQPTLREEETRQPEAVRLGSHGFIRLHLWLAHLPCDLTELTLDGAAQDLRPGGEEVHTLVQVLHPRAQRFVGLVRCCL